MANRKQMARAAEAAARQAAQDKIGKRNKLIAIGGVLLAAIVALIALLGGGKEDAWPGKQPTAADLVATDYIQIEVADYGTITAELYGKAAPITVANFLKLVNEGFYDGLTFHRPSFIISTVVAISPSTAPDSLYATLSSTSMQ